MSTPADIIKKILIDAALAPDSKTAAWAPYVAFLPDTPDTAIAIYDTAGTMNGRLMRGGEKIEHPGIQIRVRSTNYINVWEKAKAIATALDSFLPRSVVVMTAGDSWQIQNISRTSPIINAGVEGEGDRRRHNLTINAIMTLREVTESSSEYEDYLVMIPGQPGYYEPYQVQSESDPEVFETFQVLTNEP